MSNYLFSDGTGFHGAAWIATLVWVFALGIGFYFYQLWSERNPLRLRFVRQFGLGLTILGAVGLVLLALKAFNVPVIDWRIWTYLVALVTLVFLGWGAYYYFSYLPTQIAAARQVSSRSRGTGGGARTYPAGSPPASVPRPAAPPRPVATTGRREARRDKKRKSR